MNPISRLINSRRRNRKINQILNIFQTSYEMKENFKVGKYTTRLLFPKHRVAVEMGEYNKTDKKTVELEKNGIRVLNIPDTEDVFSASGRLLYVLNNTIPTST